MVSNASLDYEPEDNDQYTPAASPWLTPHLDDFTQPEIEQDPLAKARDLLDQLLDMSCEVPLHEVSDMAEDAGVKTTDILNWAETSDSCYVDWISGHIRCNEPIEDENDADPS